MKDRLNDFLVSYMKCADSKADPKQIQNEISSLTKAFALRGGSYGVGELPKEAGNYGYQLEFTVSRQPESYGVVGIAANFQIECGWDALLAVFQWNGESWEQVIEWSSRPYKTVGGAFWAFDFAISPPDGNGRWYVATKSVSPWCSSTWSSISYSLLRPLPGTLEPQLLRTGSDPIWWGNDDLGTISIRNQRTDLRFHAQSIDGGVHNRLWIRDFEVMGDTVKRVPPVAISPRDLVDEWIVSPWKEASGWSAPANLVRLRESHKQINKDGAGEFDSIRICSDATNHFQVATERDNESHLYFQVTESGENFLMRSVGLSPDARCTGKDVLESTATK